MPAEPKLPFKLPELDLGRIKAGFSTNKITTLNAIVIIAALGFIVFASGIANPFMGDDVPQIVDSVPVHSISNIQLFFEGGTFYNNQGLAPLGGAYYRPLMVSSYSFLYSVFGPSTIAFHLFQLLLHIMCAIFLFLIFRYFFRPSLALILSLVFLVHPINSQAVFAIPSLQEPLFFFFGILGVWLLLRYHSVRSLIPVVGSLFLSLLSKETGVLFVAILLLYLLLFDRKRVLPFIGLAAIPLTAYLALKLNAVGLSQNPNNAPIDNLPLWSRLMNTPSILSFYIFTLLLPLSLASGYYWIHSQFSLSQFWLPMSIALAVLAVVIWGGVVAYRRFPRTQFLTFVFFGLWALLGLFIHLQIIPLDLTVAETWFYFPMVGILGMAGVIIQNVSFRLPQRWAVGMVIVIIGLLSVRTAARGFDWSSDYSLAKHDVAASNGDYIAQNHIALHLFSERDFEGAKKYANESVATFPNAVNYNTLGQAESGLGQFKEAVYSFKQSIKYQDIYQPYENLAALTAGYGDPKENKEFLLSALKKFPGDASIWMYLAILEYRTGDVQDAQDAIGHAYNLSQSDTVVAIYQQIMNNQPLRVQFSPGPSAQDH